MYVLLSDLNALIFLSIVLEIEIYIEIIKKIQNIYFFLSPQENSVQLTFTFDLKSRSIQCCAQSLSCVHLYATPWSLPSSSIHGDSPGKNTGVGQHTTQNQVSLTHVQHRNTKPSKSKFHHRGDLLQWKDLIIQYNF